MYCCPHCGHITLGFVSPLMVHILLTHPGKEIPSIESMMRKIGGR